MAYAASESLAGRLGDLACFEVRGEVYAVDVQQIREIVRAGPFAPLPDAPPLIEGVMDLRGATLPIVDLGRALCGETVAPAGRPLVVVLDVDGLVFGARVDAAVDVLPLDATSLEPAPALAVQAGYEAVRAVVRRPGRSPVLVLSIEHLLERLRASAPAAGAAS